MTKRNINIDIIIMENDMIEKYNNNNEQLNDDSDYELYTLMIILLCTSISMGISVLLPICKNKINYFCIMNYNNNIDDELLLDECIICLEKYNMNDKIVRLNCSHIYHRDCIKSWFNKKMTCPICRYDIL